MRFTPVGIIVAQASSPASSSSVSLQVGARGGETPPQLAGEDAHSTNLAKRSSIFCACCCFGVSDGIRRERMSAKFWHRLSHERELWQKGVSLVAGVDEAGCGPLAGPVVAAAVVFPATWLATGLCSKLRGLNDSK